LKRDIFIEQRFFEQCRKVSTDYTKCDYCEFRFKCYTSSKPETLRGYFNSSTSRCDKGDIINKDLLKKLVDSTKEKNGINKDTR
jgi:hypothetical protein